MQKEGKTTAALKIAFVKKSSTFFLFFLFFLKLKFLYYFKYYAINAI